MTSTSYQLTNNVIKRYMGMLDDTARNNFYYTALKKYAADKIVLDVGSGTGIMAFYALKYGAKFVYAVERDANASEIANFVLSSNFDTSRFKVLNADFWTDQMDTLINQPIDLFVSETVGPGLFDQGMFHTWSMLKNYASSKIISIPDTLSIDLYSWNQNFKPVLTEYNSNYNLTVDQVVDQDFFESLIKVDRRLSENDSVDNWWQRLNKEYSEPDAIKENIFSYSLDNLPNIKFSNADYPAHIKPQIDTLIEFSSPCTIGLVSKMSFENQVLFLQETSSPWSPWRYSPVLSVKNPGKYRLCYTNDRLRFMSNSEWKLVQVE